MDVVVNLQALGAPAVAAGGISLLLLKKFVDHNWKSPPDLPPLPGIYINDLSQMIYLLHSYAKWLYIYSLSTYRVHVNASDAEVPGLPVIGNLLQLKEKKPHKTFSKWALTYGPVYSIKTGSTSLVVLNSNDVAKEVASFSFILLFVINLIPQFWAEI